LFGWKVSKGSRCGEFGSDDSGSGRFSTGLVELLLAKGKPKGNESNEEES